MSGSAPNRSLTYWWISIAVFAACFATVGSLNRIASDDFEFLRVFRESSAWDAAMFFRDTWNTRWSAILWLNGWFGVYETTGSLLPYHLFTLCCLMLSSGFLLYTLFRRAGLSTVHTTLLAGCWSAALFYGSFSIPDTWFWANTSTMYGWTHVYGMLAAGVLLSERSDWRAILLLLIAGIGIGGGNEPFAMSVLLCCMVVLSPISSRITGISFVSKRPILLFFAVTLSAFLFAYTGQGHSVRSSLLPDPGFASQLWVLVKSMVKLFAIHIPSRLLPLLLLLFPFYLIGTQFPSVVRKAVVVKVVAVFAVLCVLSIAPVVWLMSEMGPERAWSQVSLYTVILIAFLWFAAGTQRPLLRQFQRLYSLLGILTVLFVAATGTTAVMQAKTYSSAWDQRMLMLDSYKKGMVAVPDTIRLTPLPPSGWLHSAEIESYPEHFTNVHLKQFTGLRQPIVVDR